MAAKNYTLGRGELYFAPFTQGTTLAEKGEAYLGNTPEFSLTVESEDLDHFSSDRGIREKDDSVQLEVTRSGSFTADDIDRMKLALFFFGSESVLAQSAASYDAEPINDVVKGRYYQLGMNDTTPAGRRDVVYPGTGGTLFELKKGVTVLVHGTDYTLEPATGRILILETSSTVVDGDDLTCDYSVAASSRERVISGSTPTVGALRLVARNPKGKDFDYFLPYVKLSPNGDYSLKGDDWNTIPFNLEILRLTGREAIYVDGRPYQPA